MKVNFQLSAMMLCLIVLFGGTVDAEDSMHRYVLTQKGERALPRVAVDNVCAWPNLSKLHDGTIIATIHNQPAHLKLPADVDCWASVDGGMTWSLCGTPAPRDTETVARGNVAAGVARNGDLLVITSGWSKPATESRGKLLPLMVSRSNDGGHNWDIDFNAFPEKWPEIAIGKISPEGYLVPFGDILAGADGALYVGLYGATAGQGFVYRSDDDGRTWGEGKVMDKEAIIHEPALFHLGGGRWLAAARYKTLTLYISEDDARTWTVEMPLTGQHEFPGHFTRLNDGRILLSYGNRSKPKGVDVRFSTDAGATWSAPYRVMGFEGDGGYPSSVQRADGKIVTAYYASKIEGHDRYHMGVVIWDPVTTGKLVTK